VSFTTPSVVYDFASEIDSLEDELCDRFGLSERQAEQIAEWHRNELENNGGKSNAKTLQLIAGGLLEKGNIKIKTLGLVFAAGFNLMNGWKTEREAARMTGFTVAAINQAKDFWIRLLDIPRQNSKSDEAREKYRINGINNHWRNRRSLTT
jgi:hypothetical protein